MTAPFASRWKIELTKAHWNGARPRWCRVGVICDNLSLKCVALSKTSKSDPRVHYANHSSPKLVWACGLRRGLLSPTNQCRRNPRDRPDCGEGTCDRLAPLF